jgi:hypothetical protein
MGTRKLWIVIALVGLAVLGAFWFFLAPTGRKAVEAIDDTASEVTGKRAVDQYQPVRSEAEDISDHQRERLRQMGLGRDTEAR